MAKRVWSSDLPSPPSPPLSNCAAKRVCSSNLSSPWPSPASCATVKKRVCSSDLSPSAAWPSSSKSNWSCLPRDVLDLIIEKLAILSDIVRLGAVCKSWNSVALDHKEELKRLINHPWQLVIHSDRKHMQLQLFHFANSEFFKFQLHNPFDEAMIFRGSSHGWLVFKKNRFQLVVLNPLSGKIIDLPPINRSSRFSEFGKVVLSRDPCLGSFDVLVNFYNHFNEGALAHLKFGDEFWTYLDWYGELGIFEDITFYDKLIFVVSSKGRIVSLEIDHDIGWIKFKEEIAPNFSWKFLFSSYFVEASNGDLLIVYSSIKDFDKAYSVYKLEHSNGEFQRIQVENLGDQSLFIGTHNCTSVVASNYPGYKATTIYCSFALLERYPGAGHTYKVQEFNLEDQNIIDDRRSYGLFFETAWFVPSINF